jgi:twinkle protein
MDYRDYNIDIRTAKTTGQYYTICPQCSHTRKKKTDKCLSINLDKQVWKCQHCAWSGGLGSEKLEKVEYIKPIWKNNTELSDKLVNWFLERKISQSTLNDFKVSEGLEYMPQISQNINTIQFNYFSNDILLNVKYRSANKLFKLHKGSELVFYNLDCAKDVTELIICEGEIDCLSFYECGYKNVVSVPNGANINTNNLQYLDNCIDLLEHIEVFYLATDNDIAGRKLRYELAERLGLDKCKYIEFDEYKDCNDLLKFKGKIGVDSAYDNAKDFPIEGVYTISDIDLEINDMYVNGLDNGVETGMFDFDQLLRTAKGYTTIITGVPGHGKSDFLDQWTLKLTLSHNWKFAFYSPENRPTRLHFSKLARKLVGKKWFGQNRIDEDELEQSKLFLNGKFWFIKPPKDFSLDSILSSVKQLKKTKGVDAYVIDAWNKLEHKYTGSETKYIGESLDKINSFNEENNVHCFLIAHPTKLAKNKDTGLFEIPNLYNISGSANFYNKTDNGLTVYRNYTTNKTEVYVQKVKFSHWGKVGNCEFDYDLDSGRFKTSSDDNFNWIENQIQKEAIGGKEIEVIEYKIPLIHYSEAKNNFDNIPF